MVEPKYTFSAADYVVFALLLLLSAGVGVYYAFCGGKQKTTQEFLMANRSMSVVPVALSMLASFMSAITLLGTPAEMFIFGTQYWMIGVSYFFVIPIAAYLYAPIFYNLELTSVFEYLEMRFSTAVRTLGSVIFMTQMLMYMAIVLYAPSLALEAVTGFNVWGAVFSVGVVCTFYTTLGGMKAVMWTDTFQMVVMFGAMIAILIRGCMDPDVRGFSQAWNRANRHARIEFFNFDPDPTTRHSIWNLVIGGTFTWVAVYGVNQAQVQRILSCPSLKKAQLALWLNLPGLLFLLSLVCMVGIVIFAKYWSCDPLDNKLISAKDQLLPYFVMDILSDAPGVPGIFVAGLFSGALSTISSGLNSLSAVTLQDFMRRYCFKGMTDKRALFISKCLVLSYGAIVIALTFVASQLGGVLEAALALFGMLGGPLLGLFSLGIFFPWANSWGAIGGTLTSVVLLFWIGIGAKVVKPAIPVPPVYNHGCKNHTGPTPLFQFPVSLEAVPAPIGVNRVYALSYMWYSATAVLVVIVVGLVISFISGATKAEDVDHRLICPFFDVLMPWLPERWRQKLWCGVKHSKKRRRTVVKTLTPSDIPDAPAPTAHHRQRHHTHRQRSHRHHHHARPPRGPPSTSVDGASSGSIATISHSHSTTMDPSMHSQLSLVSFESSV